MFNPYFAVDFGNNKMPEKEFNNLFDREWDLLKQLDKQYAAFGIRSFASSNDYIMLDFVKNSTKYKCFYSLKSGRYKNL